MDSASKPATEYGERIYDELNTGDWWNDTVKMKEMPKDATLLPIILYTDGTWLSKNGAHNAKPLSMTIGNFPRHVMNKNKAKTVRWTPKLDKNLKFFVVFCCHLGSVLHAQSQCAKKAKAVQGFQGIQARSIS